MEATATEMREVESILMADSAGASGAVGPLAEGGPSNFSSSLIDRHRHISSQCLVLEQRVGDRLEQLNDMAISMQKFSSIYSELQTWLEGLDLDIQDAEPDVLEAEQLQASIGKLKVFMLI